MPVKGERGPGRVAGSVQSPRSNVRQERGSSVASGLWQGTGKEQDGPRF